MAPIRIDRFSPYHQRPADFGLTIRPCQTYSYIYPLPPQALAELAYFFEDDTGSGREKVQLHHGVPQRPGLAALYHCLNDWISQWRRAQLLKTVSPPLLRLVDSGSELIITDTRSCAVEKQHRLTGLTAQVYRACDQAVTPKSLLQALHPAGATWAEVQPALAELRQRKLILELNGRFLSLAVREPDRPLLKEHPGGSVNLLAYKKGSSQAASRRVAALTELPVETKAL
jgi:magnesium-protoporphyrin IX monomethyl ester (oxidative) cyclase